MIIIFLMIFLSVRVFYGIFFLIMLHRFKKAPTEGKYFNLTRISRPGWFILVVNAVCTIWAAINAAILAYDIINDQYGNDMFSGFREIGAKASLLICAFTLTFAVLSLVMAICGEAVYYRKIKGKYTLSDKEQI